MKFKKKAEKTAEKKSKKASVKSPKVAKQQVLKSPNLNFSLDKLNISTFNPVTTLKSKRSILAIQTFLLLFVAIGWVVATPELVRLTEKKADLGSAGAFKNIQVKAEEAPLKREPVLEIIDAKIPIATFSAQAVLAKDMGSGKVLFQKNINTKMSPASTTKIMTALVALEHFEEGDILTVKQIDLVSGSTMGLELGEKLTFRSLLYGMMLNSGNDAAYTIATNYPGGLSAFVKAMNDKALELGLKNTNFENPAGFDGTNHYSSAADLLVIAQEAYKNPLFAKIVASSNITLSNVDNTKEHQLKNLNILLSEPGVIGIKTGYTEIAGENFVGLVERNNQKVLTVVLKSTDRFGESKRLMNWVYQNFSWQYH